MFKKLSLLSLALTLVSAQVPAALAIVTLSDSTINDAVRYGLENQDVGLSSFLGSNWREGSDGALLNIYTPYMEIARSAARQKMTDTPNAKDIAKARQEIIEDIDYIWHHPSVKFMVSMFGDNPGFAKNYYARIEGVGRGRTYTIYPTKRIPQNLADKEEGAELNPYTAVNSYHFNFDQVAPMDEFTFILYGDNVKPMSFKVNNAYLK